MAAIKYGYVGGTRPRTLISLPVKASATWGANDFLTKDSSGYYSKAGDGDTVFAVAFDEVTTAPATDGASTALGDISPDSVYRIPINQGGPATPAMRQKTCDLGVTSGVQGADLDLSADDNLLIVDVEIADSQVLVQIRPPVVGVA